MFLEFSSVEELDAAQAETANPYLADSALGLQLITQLIAQPRDSRLSEHRRQLHRLHQLIHQSFVNLAARDDYPAEAQAYRELVALEQSLEDLVAFPDLANKTVIGVGGGFSAGKSRFLNSLLCVDVLPESLEPTTAIPSYIVRGESERITALNSFTQEVTGSQRIAGHYPCLPEALPGNTRHGSRFCAHPSPADDPFARFVAAPRLPRHTGLQQA